MPLPRIELADWRADELAEEMLRRAQAHVPEWRPQPGDPHRTLIELFAWLGETLLYRASLVPERQRYEFLKLLGEGLRPARPASGLIALAPARADAPEPARLAPERAIDGPVPFETTGHVEVMPFEGRVHIKRRPAPEELESLGPVLDDLAALYGIPTGTPYVTTELFADGRARTDGVDVLGRSVDRAMWIALLATDDGPASRTAALAAFARRPALLNVGIVPRLRLPDPDAPPEPIPDMWRWQITTGNLLPDGRAEFATLEVDRDDTAGLAREGCLRLLLPPPERIGAPTNDVGIDVQAGVGLRPPRIDDPDLAARLLAWIRLTPATAGTAALPLSWAGINAVAIDQRKSFRNVVIGAVEGLAGEEARLPAGSVDKQTLALELIGEDGAYRAWRRVDDLAACGPDDRCFELDEEAGTLRFGDGLRGRSPATGARIRIAFMRAGGGRAGNLPPGSLAAVSGSDLVVTQPAPTTGGEDAETLEAAERRLPARLRHRERCITAEDYRDVALTTPAVALGRVEILPRFRPFQRRPEVPGVVSVMVLPEAGPPTPPNPRPDRNLVERVKAHLDARRPLATELHVIGCEYRPVALSAAFAVRQGFARDVVARAVREALAVHFWPLAPGARGEGWPLGEAVVAREVEVVIARIDGVRATMGVRLFTEGAAGWQPLPTDPTRGTQVLSLEPWQLPELLGVQLAIDSTSPPETLDLPGGEPGEGGVAVPVVPELC